MITETAATAHPEFCALALNVLLFKLGGQITIPMNQLAEVSKEFPSFRLAMDFPNESITLTLLSADYLNSRKEPDNGQKG